MISVLFLEIIIIIILCGIFRVLFGKIGQPSVIGEIIAGIVLGPSVLGILFPELAQLLFPKQSLSFLYVISQIGLVLFMFVIGMELEIKAIKNNIKKVLLVGYISLLLPFFLGILLSFFIYKIFAANNTSFLVFALFFSTALSITAFPVLARIVHEKGLARTQLGTFAITCASLVDITAWCILAIVVSLAKAGNITSALMTIGFSLVYAGVMIYVVKRHLLKLVFNEKTPPELLIPIALAFLFSSAYLTEIIGIHALFGAFLAGFLIPGQLKQLLIKRIKDIDLALFLPVYFVFSGLRTQINLLNKGYLWIICLLVIVVAVCGKFGGCAVTARKVGYSWKDSLTLGALMNTRGLIELIVLNIGLDLGVLNFEIFTIMVIMALFTTFLTRPALDLINNFHGKCHKETGENLMG